MNVVKLTEDNVSEYSQFVPEDVAEYVGRTYYRGIIVISDEGEPAAGMLWLLKNMRKETDRESHILWIRISDESAADTLFDEYETMIRTEEVIRSSFSLLAKTAKPIKGILKAKGFSVKLMEGDTIVAKLSEIGQIPFLQKLTPSDDVKPLRSVTQRGFNIAVRRMAEKGFYGICEDIEYLPRMYFENDVSCVCEQDGMINGLFLCHATNAGRLVVELMAAVGQDYVMTLPHLIGRAYQSAMIIYSPDTEVIIDRHNYASLALGEKFFPRTLGVPVYIGSREENGV